MKKFDRKCPKCGEITLDSTNELFICNNCGYSPKGSETIKCPICNNYGYKFSSGICNTCKWAFDKSNISKYEYQKQWKRKQQHLSKIKSSIKDEIEKYFTLNGVTYNKLSFDEMVINLYNFLFKVTLPQKYTVNISKEIEGKKEYSDLIALFKKKFENGENIIPWQSKTVLNSEYQDILFNHWNIKHLHLIIDSNKRSGDILLYIQNDDSVYFLDVIKHPKGSGWNNYNILRTVCQNKWMEYIGFIKLSSIDSNFIEGTLEPRVENEKEIQALYKLNLNMGFTIEGISYVPSPNQVVSSSGDNLKVSECYNNLNKIIDTLSSYEFISFKFNFYTCFGEIKYRKDGEEQIDMII